MRRKTLRVPQEVIDQCAEHYCADTLDMYEPAKSRGKVFEWKWRFWVCTGGASQSLQHYELHLQQVVPEAEYHGPPNDPYGGPDLYYLGGRLTCKGKVWVMTDLEIILVSISHPRTRRHKYVPPVSQ